MLDKIQPTLQILRRQMDRYVIGHDSVKEALLLAILTHEHLYLEGDPGSAKTLLAEVLCSTANMPFHYSQLHRDTRLTDLIGDVVLSHTRSKSGRSDFIQQKVREGGILTSELVMLDDISRAPGEALSILLRILNERQYQSKPIPLLTAIATTNPTGIDYYNEPLDPANLDRFIFQLKTDSILAKGQWESARQIMDLYEGAGPELDVSLLKPDLLLLAYEYHFRVKIPGIVRNAYLTFLDSLLNRYGCTPENSLLTDRTMLVRLPRMIKALALLEGRMTAMPEDLRVLKYILTFRIPESVYQRLDEILEELIEETKLQEESSPEGESNEEETQDQENEEEVTDCGEENQEGEQACDDQEPGEQEMANQMFKAVQNQDREADKSQSISEPVKIYDVEHHQFRTAPPQSVENMNILLEVIRGRLERNQADLEVHPGGAPRTYRRMDKFEDFMDSDPAETAIWMDEVHPTLPRALVRKKKHMGGKVIIVRDISYSMQGKYAIWTSSVVTRLVEVVRKKRLRIGYIEFNDASHKYFNNRRFFTRDYDKIIHEASNVFCWGATNYQHPLRDALVELKGGSSQNKHILFLTDGEPTRGDWTVTEERRLARALGVSIHTIFFGPTRHCPEILDIISKETDGSRFQAIPNNQGGLNMNTRKESPCLHYEEPKTGQRRK